MMAQQTDPVLTPKNLLLLLLVAPLALASLFAVLLDPGEMARNVAGLAGGLVVLFAIIVRRRVSQRKALPVLDGYGWTAVIVFPLLIILDAVLFQQGGGWAVRLLQARWGLAAMPWQEKTVAAIHAAIVTSFVFGAIGPWVVKQMVWGNARLGGIDRLKAFVATLPMLALAALLLSGVNLFLVFGPEIEAAIEAVTTAQWTRVWLSILAFWPLLVFAIAFVLTLSKAMADAYLRLDPELMPVVPQGEPG